MKNVIFYLGLIVLFALSAKGALGIFFEYELVILGYYLASVFVSLIPIAIVCYFIPRR